MRYLYRIGIPRIPGLPYALHEPGKDTRKVTLREVQHAVFAAVLQGHQVYSEKQPGPLLEAVIFIIDGDEFEAGRAQWIKDHAHLSLEEAMEKDKR